MRFALLTTLFAMSTLSTFAAAPEKFYVAAKDGIYVGELDVETGNLAPLKLAVAADAPAFMAMSPVAPVLFASFHHAVGAYRIEADDKLAEVGKYDTGDSDGCHIAVDHTGTRVYTAGYGQGSMTRLQVSTDGAQSLGKFAVEPFHGTGPNMKRQEKSHVHSINPDPENRLLYICDLGADKVWIRKVDANDSTPARSEFAEVPPGSGPRHLAFSPDGRFVYVANELTGTVTTFSRNAATGELTPLSTVTNFMPDQTVHGPATAEIVCHPSGKWLYVSNRGNSSISVFTLGADGKPTLVQCGPSVATSVWNFWIDPSGKWIVAGGQGDNRLVVLKIDAVSGQLSATDQAAPVSKPQCVLFAPKKV